MATSEETPILESAHTADQIKSYVLRSDAIASCSVLDAHVIPQALKDIEAYWLGNVPCRNVRLVGILIAATEYESRSIYLIDDGTASINCLKKRPVRVELEKLAEGSSFHQARGYNIGDIVSVVGKIETYKGLRQIYVSSIQRCLSPDAESRHLLDVLEQHRTVYSQPFVIPPLPVLSTPRKHERSNSQPNYASSTASTPTTISLSSPIRSPQKKAQMRLRHPSRLRSKDLNENVFRMYLSHVMISTLSVPESAFEDTLFLEPALENVDNSTPKLSRTRNSTSTTDTTPKRLSRHLVDPIGSPTPKKSTAQSLSIAEVSPNPILGVTLSYLRRVQMLAELARRVVDQAAHDRDKMLRHAERNARTKYEALHQPSLEHRSSRSTGTSSVSEASRSATASHHKKSSTTTSSKLLERSSLTDAESSQSQYSTTAQKHSTSRISRVPSALHGSSSRSKSQHALMPEEAARRAAYHAKQSKLHAEDRQKRPARTKRLFESALRTLVREGELIVYEGPRRRIPAFNKPTGRTASALHGIWADVTNTTASSGMSLSTVSSALSAPSCSDLDTISEDDNEPADVLSDPSDSEDAYIPVTPYTLRPAMLSALRQNLLRRSGGVDLDSWMRTLRSDDQWARVPDLVVQETLEVLRQEEWIVRIGGGRWDFTRGSWARSLKLS